MNFIFLKLFLLGVLAIVFVVAGVLFIATVYVLVTELSQGIFNSVYGKNSIDWSSISEAVENA